MLYERVKEKTREYKTIVQVVSVFSLLLYSFFMSQQLTNSMDGFWQQNYYLAGEWEIGCGRWLWPYIDKIQFGIHNDPLTSIIALFIFIIGYIMILDMFEIKNNVIGIVGGLMFISCRVLQRYIVSIYEKTECRIGLY